MREISSDKKSLILFIDDDASLLRLGRLNLERAGHVCVGALGGREGLARARTDRPDLILLDYMMPDLSGKEVFEELRASDDAALRNTPVIMLTARTNNETEQRELLEMGLAAYLHKPFGYRELLNVIDNVLVLSRIKERNRILELQARRSFVATVRTLITLLFAKDSYTGEHSKNTARLAEGVALCCGLTEEEAVFIKLGALLHDVGKIGVPEHVLCKPTGLTEEETAIMRRHVYHGEQALAGVPHMTEVRSMVMHHHEWWNGGGYPAGLCGEEIPLGARIIAVVDAYDAMTSDRPYRQHLPQAVAIERLRAGAGTQFDPIIVGKLFDYLNSHDLETDAELDLEFIEELCPIGEQRLDVGC
ncbi:MAG TPA: HD domain-containing phosphohydrolase [Pyrinomonadaceae bacterium]|jgi:putative two-component system response regulator|nr:HD domain-containing phosphohydrolase [Pyrinomonadaceae bacterium]